MFLRNVVSHKKYTAPHPIKRHSSISKKFFLLGLKNIGVFSSVRHEGRYCTVMLNLVEIAAIA
jgi:hypothetical protein